MIDNISNCKLFINQKIMFNFTIYFFLLIHYYKRTFYSLYFSFSILTQSFDSPRKLRIVVVISLYVSVFIIYIIKQENVLKNSIVYCVYLGISWFRATFMLNSKIYSSSIVFDWPIRIKKNLFLLPWLANRKLLYFKE